MWLLPFLLGHLAYHPRRPHHQRLLLHLMKRFISYLNQFRNAFQVLSQRRLPMADSLVVMKALRYP